MPKLVISHRAKQDIKHILENVGEYTGSVRTIEKLRNEFLEKFNQILLLPRSARLLDDGTRQTFCRRYRIIYQQIDDEIHILTVVHSLKKYP